MSERKGSRSLPIVSASGLPMDRRQALKVMAIAAAAPGIASCAPGDAGTTGSGGVDAIPNPSNNPLAAGTAWDPDLVAPSVLWERVLMQDELQSLAALCDVIIPADDRSPAASQVGAHDFIDEWVSAPYDGNARELVMIRGGLAWLDRETASRFGAGSRFRDLAGEQQRMICDDICYLPETGPEHEFAARFFDRVRDLTSTAFWTTQQGMDDLQYIGNIPLPQWDPPPAEVLRHIGIE